MPTHVRNNRDSRVRQPSRRLTPREQRSAELRRQRRMRCASRIYRLGERVEFELVEHFIRIFDLNEDAVDQILDRFAGTDPAALALIIGRPPR